MNVGRGTNNDVAKARLRLIGRAESSESETWNNGAGTASVAYRQLQVSQADLDAAVSLRLEEDRPMRRFPNRAAWCPVSFLILSLLALTRCAADPAKVVFVPGRESHGYGMHEHRAGLLLLARSLQQQWPELETIVTDKDAWPAPEVLADADALVIACEGSKHVVLPHLDEVDALARGGLGIALIHYAVEPPDGPGAEAVRRWIGGNFERGWSINPDWAAEFVEFPDHPAANGLMPFSAYDEWYFNMRFVADRKRVTPILEARPPLSTLLRNNGPSSNNPEVTESVLRGDSHAVAWAYDRPGGGRGFGFSGAHHHFNYRDDNFRKTVLNGIAWVAGLEVPSEGVESTRPTWQDIAANQDYNRPPNWEQEAGLAPLGSADPVYSTPPILLHATKPLGLQVEIPPARYRHIYFVFESDSSSAAGGPAKARVRWQNARFRGESGQEAPLNEEKVAHFLGSEGPRQPPTHWAEPDKAMEIPVPSLLHYPVPRGSTHFLSEVSFHADEARETSGNRQARVHVFFAPPAERFLRAPFGPSRDSR